MKWLKSLLWYFQGWCTNCGSKEFTTTSTVESGYAGPASGGFTYDHITETCKKCGKEKQFDANQVWYHS